MKKLILCSFVFLVSCSLHAQMDKINQLFNQYEDAEGITSIRIAAPMFRLLNNLKIEDDDLNKIRPLLSNINSIQILIFQKQKKDSLNPTPKIDQLRIKNDIYGAVKKLNFEELMSINSNGHKIKFLSENTSSNILNKLLLSINSDDENLLMLLDGKINMNELSKLIDDENAQTVSKKQ